MAWETRTGTIEVERAPEVHVNLISGDADRRQQLLDRLRGDERFTLAVRANRRGAVHGVVALDVAGAEAHAVELVHRLTRDPQGPKVLAVVDNEDDLVLARRLVLAGAAGVTSLRQPASGLCQAVLDVAGGLASVSAALAAELVRQLQALPEA